MPRTQERRQAVRRTKKSVPDALEQRLVLCQWFFSNFGVSSLEEFCEPLKDDRLEGLDANNVSNFHHVIVEKFPDLPNLTVDLLLEYDLNIGRHTAELNEARTRLGEAPISWKYFQYVALLATEIYLDRYFRDASALRSELNEVIAKFNETKAEPNRLLRFFEGGDARMQLNKLAFWMATGSGKTLIMHVHILQFQNYARRYQRTGNFNRVLLLTPNEGLSRQHLEEFRKSGIAAEIFAKDGRSLFTGQSIEVLEISKLREEMGQKSVAIDAFENNNLVLVDEGHRGASVGEDGAWMRARNMISEKGFSFEYSATFAQVTASSPKLAEQYAKSILFDYSYRYFYRDGFGKDYRILNLEEDTERTHLTRYLIACLLTYFQQLKIWESQARELLPFNIEKPLLVFVGGSVTATLANRDASDIIEVLKFIAGFVNDKRNSITHIEAVLASGIINSSGRNMFAGRFIFLNTCGLTAEQIYAEILQMVFSATAVGQLYVKNIKGVTGELALSVGMETTPFGVINVGDDAKLFRLCEQNELNTADAEFGQSLFEAINRPGGSVNVLIGSRKFTEGWNSWRVSTMGLMNIGKSEGAQIIQLFGRGVRLKGYRRQLKRSNAIQLPEGVSRPAAIGEVETLDIFGIRANYMAQFRDFLEEEGVPANEGLTEVLLPVVRHIPDQPLKIVRVKPPAAGFKRGEDQFRTIASIPVLGPPTEYLRKHKVVVNWYPRIKSMSTRGQGNGDSQWVPREGWLNAEHIAFLDLDAIYLESEKFKSERGWDNLLIPYESIASLLADPSWYTLLISPEALAFDEAEKIANWQLIAETLLRKYIARYYAYRRNEWELPRLEYRELEYTEPNLLGIGKSSIDPFYSVRIDASRTDVIAKLEQLRASIERGLCDPFSFDGINALWFSRHLYEPLLYLHSSVVAVSPVPLNPGERTFVDDLKQYYCAERGGFLRGKELFLLRNLSRGHGVGFFEAGNFYPDFIMWLIDEKMQHIVFIDPKGLINLEGLGDPKIRFHATIKEIEARLRKSNPLITLDSFIVSVTPVDAITSRFRTTVEELRTRNVVFQQQSGYIADIVTSVISKPPMTNSLKQ